MPRTRNTAEAVWKRLAVGGPDECWPFVGGLSSRGYGQFWFDGRLHTAHVVAWELVNGPVPQGKQLDHLCRNRACGNPAHLEPVTSRENTRRSPLHNGSKTHCPSNHAYTPENTRLYRGARYCRTCQNTPNT